LLGGGVRRPVRRADSLTAFVCLLSCNPVALTPGPVHGLVYLEVSPKVRLSDKAVLLSVKHKT